ncbi:amidohydrolase [Jeotgalicoccus sp. S0W5]|uniref:amidohydrolase n=1 Tax=Jeotgalicoccus sp. S0W5 TaxID=2527874 RepID=UPI0014151356|nr:amidohydrolase [Jeotgalicoccus sp. S0W5]
MSLKEKIFKQLEENEERMIEIRRHLHENPELSFEEEKTAQFIEEFYKDKDVTLTTNVGNGYGIIVEIEGGAGEGPTIGLRADFDALPIKEEADVEFKSKNEGVMHACGHDGHTAYMLILGEALIDLKDEWKGRIKLIHQHAEEIPPGGAKSIVESGILDDLDEVYGIHLFPTIDVGDITVCAEEAMTGRSNFDLKIQGSGGHGAMPHTTNDALVAGGYFVTSAQTIVSRRMDPNDSVVVSITAFDAPGGYNVIQDSVTLRGTVRYLSMDNMEPVYEEMKNLVEGLERSYGVDCTLDYVYDYPVLYNIPEIIDEIEATLEESAGTYFDKVYRAKPQAASEDFAYYLEKKPGAFIFVGAKPEGVENAYPNHHPKFEVNEKSLLISAKALADIVLNKIQ